MTNPVRWLGDQVTAAITRRIEDKLNQAGAAWEARSRALAPVRTGYLRSQETYSVANRTLTLHMGAFYDIFTEFGTRNMRAIPHVRPALNEVGRVFGGSIEMHFNSISYANPIYYHRGNYVVPGTLTRGQRRHVAEHLLPKARQYHRGNVRRAGMTVGGR